MYRINDVERDGGRTEGMNCFKTPITAAAGGGMISDGLAKLSRHLLGDDILVGSFCIRQSNNSLRRLKGCVLARI